MSSAAPESFTFDVASLGSTTGRIRRSTAEVPRYATLLLAHGAGASQDHPFMTAMTTRLAHRGLDVVTFDFLYMSAGRKMPDRNEKLEACWRAAIATVRARVGLPTERLFLGGKSMGGRIASQVAAADEGLRASGLVFFGYPLHPVGKPTVRRDAHLSKVPFPMLFVQGSRDDFGDATEMKRLVKGLPAARLHLVKDGDHSLAIPKRLGVVRQERVLEEAADAVASFVGSRVG